MQNSGFGTTRTYSHRNCTETTRWVSFCTETKTEFQSVSTRGHAGDPAHNKARVYGMSYQHLSTSQAVSFY